MNFIFQYFSQLLANKRAFEKNELEYEKSILFDAYTCVIITIFISCSILSIFFLKLFFYGIIYFGIGLLLFSTLFWPDKIRFNRYLLISVFFFLGILIFYLDATGGKESMNYMSYISLTIAISFIFDYKKDKYFIYILIFSYIILFLTNVLTNYSSFSSFHINYTTQKKQYIRTYKTGEVIFSIIMGMYFIYRKEKMILKYYIEKEKLNNLIKKTDKIKFSGQLYELAKNKNPLFITYFKSEFPDFFDKILKVSPDFISSELEICALLKLNFSAKDIAAVTNSTARAIQNKKYRIRKKLNLPTEIDLNSYIINTF